MTHGEWQVKSKVTVNLRDRINLKKATVARKCENTTVDDGGTAVKKLRESKKNPPTHTESEQPP